MYYAMIRDNDYAIVDQFKKPVALGRIMHDAVQRFLIDYPELNYLGELDSKAWEHRIPKFISIVSLNVLLENIESNKYQVVNAVVDRAHRLNVVEIREVESDERHFLSANDNIVERLAK